MKQETTQQPLYKVLNQQRTQGEWKLPEQEKELNSYSLITDGMSIATVYAIDIPDEEGLANAQYTALAVNNLAHVSDALKELDDAAIRFADDHKHYYDKGDFEMIDSMLATLHNAHLKAKEALNSIS